MILMCVGEETLSFKKKCDSCMCTHADIKECKAYDSADRWLQANSTEIKGKFFENVAETYEVIRPGHFRPFMLAWVDRFGGI
jgi:hypothetical protein